MAILRRSLRRAGARVKVFAMKNWLGAAGRLCADFVLFLLVFSATAALGQSPGGAPAGDLIRNAAAAAETFYPLAAAAAIILGTYAFERHIRLRFLSWLSALVLGFGLLAGGAWLRRSDPISAAGMEGPKVAAGVFVERGPRALYVKRYEGSGALRAFGVATDSPRMPRVVYAPLAVYDSGRGSVMIDGQAFPTFPPGLPPNGRGVPERHLGPLIPGVGRGALDQRLAGLDRLSFPFALAVLGGFALLAAGFASLASLPRWPLVGFFFAAAGFLALVLLDTALTSTAVTWFFDGLRARFGLGGIPGVLAVAALEAALGLVLGLASLAAPARDEP